MLSKEPMRCSLRALLLFMPFFVLAGYAAQQGTVGGSQDTTVTLTYQFPEGKTLSYGTTNTSTQYIDVMGQSMTTQSLSTLEFTAKAKGSKEDQYTLGVTVDVFKASAQTPQGEVSPDTSAVVGKSFDMILSRLGKEIDLKGASSLQYGTASGGQRDIASSFQTFFPDLPDRPVKSGDTWPSEDTVTQKAEGGEIHLAFKHVNTLDGFETVDGYECARIKTTIQGTMAGSIEQGGVGLSIDGKIVGTETWYFATKEGIFVKSDMQAKIEASITAGDPMNATFPMTGEEKAETHLIKK